LVRSVTGGLSITTVNQGFIALARSLLSKTITASFPPTRVG
jgi:hypothetical protein